MTDAPDLTGFAVVHRAMRRDLRRLVDATAPVTMTSPKRPPLTSARIAAVDRYAREILEEIHHHHSTEDDVLWPIIVRHAGSAVDLAPLTDDHVALDPLLEKTTATRRAFLDDPLGAAGEFSSCLTALADLLDEHILDEERTVFPIIQRYVPVPEYTRFERQLRMKVKVRRVPFLLPWLASHATADEQRRMFGAPPVRAALAVLRPRFERRSRVAFGSTYPPEVRL